MKEISEISTKLPALERDYRESPSPSKLDEITKLKSKFTSILSNQTSEMLQRIKQKHFELSDKPERLLARQLKALQADRSIHKINTTSGSVTTDPTEINHCFRTFYEDLYTSKTNADESQINDFLSTLHLPKLSLAAQTELNTNINLAEVMEAIRAYPNGKTAGPSGYGIEFYKAYAEKLAPIMLRMFNHSIGPVSSQTPYTWLIFH